MLFKFVKSQSGFSIIQGLILAAAVAGMAYVGTLLMNEQKLAQRGVQAKSNNERLHDMIYSILQNKDHCTATMVANGFVVNSTAMTLGTSRTLTQIRPMNSASAPFTVKAGSTYTAAEKYMNGTLGITAMTVAMPTTTFENQATLTITYERLGQGFAGKTISKGIAIKFQNDATNRFQSCYAVEQGTNQDLVKNFCNTLGVSDGVASTVDSIFEWDPATNMCKFKDLRCPIGQIFSGFDSTGVRRCHTIQQWSNISNFLDTADSTTCVPGAAPSVRFVFTAGAKMKIDCGTTSCTTSCNCPNSNMYCRSGGCTTTQPVVGNSCSASENCVHVTNNVFLACSGGYWIAVNGVNPGCTWPKSMTPCP